MYTTLDQIILKFADDIIDNTFVHDTLISDHYWIHHSLNGSKPHTVQNKVSFRKLKSISIEQFESDILASPPPMKMKMRV